MGTLWGHYQVSEYLGDTNHSDPVAYLAKWSKSWNDVIMIVTEKYNALMSGKDPKVKDAAVENVAAASSTSASEQ
jgi:hypothetical protein